MILPGARRKWTPTRLWTLGRNKIHIAESKLIILGPILLQRTNMYRERGRALGRWPHTRIVMNLMPCNGYKIKKK